MSRVLMIVGEGLLADFVYRNLSSQYKIVHQPDCSADLPKEVELAFVLHDFWYPSIHLQAEETFRTAGIPWLRGFVSFGEGVVGPLVRSHTPGCSQCADFRRLMTRKHRIEMWEIQQQLKNQKRGHRDAWASNTGMYQLANMIAAEGHRVLQRGRAYTDQKIYLVNLQTLATSSHFFLQNPTCPVCGGLPEDTPEAARITLQPRPKTHPTSYRTSSLDDFKDILITEYVDFRTGMINQKTKDHLTPFAVMSVNLPMMTSDEGAAGRTLSYEQSELTAILEALERYAGLQPRGKKTVVYDRYENVKEQALDPTKIGLHSEEQYAQPDYPFERFDPKRPLKWVWGYSFLQERPILVPETLAYYDLGDDFVYENSNGCALGRSLEEAIFYGILEVVERDAFLLTWYAQLPLPRLDPESAKDKELCLMIERIKAVAGYDVYLYNATMENGIPSVWAITKNRKQRGVNLVCAAGSHPEPLRAVKTAVHELADMLLSLDEKYEAYREEFLKMLHDPYLVQSMEDHGMLYSLPEAEERLHFLLQNDRPMRTFDEEFQPPASHDDLTDDLKDILQMFKQLDLEVIVVDQTTPEMIRNELYSVKVLIPGMLPMTFGYHLTRLTGLDRVLNVPMQLGLTKHPLTYEQLNPHPHPFP
ncbi:TOMM precursor leader peptide-binding protein [Brevibacillus humidisoli]|uniref:TOMM precursor leader peptide-binding protein n=1 Tax=Brevibacillus humidisoli TaxID=2895522 RepID=UPI001E5CE127|nr:TOMM precursor leader peptide-binding protein [Brevibacillus humidisoli]UFJ41729.1 TOMM precursor leader peptide-binding protein [Brevibacillus humidisoli]